MSCSADPLQHEMSNLCKTCIAPACVRVRVSNCWWKTDQGTHLKLLPLVLLWSDTLLAGRAFLLLAGMQAGPELAKVSMLKNDF